MAGIRLHKEHGLNPTISACIICGGDKNELVLLGAAMKEKAPMKMVTSIEPCDECKKKYLTEGIMLVESNDGKAPTGNIAVIKEEAFKRIFTVPVPAGRICMVEPAVMRMIQG